MHHSPWLPAASGQPLVVGVIDDLVGDSTSVWASAPDPEDVERLTRLMERVPPHLAHVIRECTLSGRWQTAVAAELWLSQPGVWCRLAAARERLRMVAALGVDLVPDEVEAVLVGAGERPIRAKVASAYWRWHAALPAGREAGVSPTSAWTVLFSRGHGLALSHTEGTAGDIARAILTIRSWPVRPGRTSASRENRI